LTAFSETVANGAGRCISGQNACFFLRSATNSVWEQLEEQSLGGQLFFMPCMREHLYLRPPLVGLAIAVLISLWCASLPPLVAQATPPEDSQSNSIRGIVVNSLTREPISRALVFSPDNRFATMTDGEGRFEFNLPPAPADKNQNERTLGFAQRQSNRPYGLTARKPGFLNDQQAQTLPADAGKELTIPLTPESLIVGRVTLSNSEAPDTIRLEIYRRQVQEGRGHWVLANSAATKSNGEFRFADLSAGSYKLLTRELMDRDPVAFDPRGQLYGYPPAYFPNATDFAAAQTIELAAGEVFQANLSLVRHPYYQVKIPVTNMPPGTGIGVVVSAQGHRGPGFALGYNYEEQMIEGLLPNGNYTIEASGYGRSAASGVLNIGVKGGPAEGTRMNVVPNGSISVNVREEFTTTQDPTRFEPQSGRSNDGQRGPRSYLNVFLEAADDFGHERGASLRAPSGPNDESLVLESVQPGRYWVRASSSRGYIASIASGALDLQHHQLVVGFGGSSSPIEITVRDGGAELDGTVEGAAAQLSVTENSGATVRNLGQQNDAAFAHVYCIPLPDSGGEFKEIWVSQDGKFDMQEVPPGAYRVLAFDRAQPQLEYSNPEGMRAYEAKGEVVRLVAGQKEHLRLQLISSSE
jgi:hypothetical protein